MGHLARQQTLPLLLLKNLLLMQVSLSYTSRDSTVTKLQLQYIAATLKAFFIEVL